MIDYMVYIGRFQPFHNGHKNVIEQALKLADKVIVVIGSANTSQSAKNPFTYEERKFFIESTMANPNIIVIPSFDHPDESVWERRIVEAVRSVSDMHLSHMLSHKIGLIGHDKDDSSYYLGSFPNWKYHKADNFEGINATDIRKKLFSKRNLGANELLKIVPLKVIEALGQSYIGTERHLAMKAEYKYLAAYKKPYSKLPYPPVFVTVDAVILKRHADDCYTGQNEVLMIRRGNHPGKGLLALPGGFVEEKDNLEEALIKELKEEVGLEIDEFPNSFTVFDNTNRSQRGRTITHAMPYHLPEDLHHKIKAGSDAESVEWISIKDLDPREIHEDHYFIIQSLCGRRPF